MRTITLFLCAALAVTSVDAASYQKTNGTIVNPILDNYGNVLAYSGNNLEPSAQLTFTNLSHANLTDADLSSANLHYAILWEANLTGASLTGANLFNTSLPNAYLYDADLSYANLYHANLYDADLTGANLSGSILTDTTYYTDATWTDAFYYTDNEPTWRSGMDAAWRTSVGILALAPTSAVPEPAAILLALFGLALLPRRRRKQ